MTTDLKHPPTTDAVTRQNYDHKALRNALTTPISIRKIHYAALVFEVADGFNAYNAEAIRNGEKTSITADSGICRYLAPQRVRHDFTNYDDIWMELNRLAQSDHVHQVVYCRTMRIIKDAYPELGAFIEREVDRKYPLQTRKPVCMPTTFADVVREVKRIEDESGHENLTDQALKDAATEFILDTQTYLREQSADLLESFPPAESASSVAQLKEATVAIVHLAYPELKYLGKPDNPAPGRPYAPSVPPLKLQRKSSLGKQNTSNTHVLVDHLLRVLKPEATVRVADSGDGPTETRIRLLSDLEVTFVLPPKTLDEVHAAVIKQFNSVKGISRYLDLSDEETTEEIHLRAVNHAVAVLSNYGAILKVISGLSPSSRAMARKRFEKAVEGIISERYPQLKEASARERKRRLTGGRFNKAYGFRVAQRTPEPPANESSRTSPDAPVQLEFEPVAYEELMRTVVRHHNKSRKTRASRSFETLEPSALLKHQRQAIRLLKTRHSNFNVLMSRIGQLPKDEQVEPRSAVLEETAVLLMDRYPELRAAIKAELG